MKRALKAAAFILVPIIDEFYRVDVLTIANRTNTKIEHR